MCIYSDVYTLCDWKPRIKIQPLVLSSVVDQGSRRHMGLISQRGQPVHELGCSSNFGDGTFCNHWSVFFQEAGIWFAVIARF